MAEKQRVKFIGRHLMVKGEYVGMILSGEKTTTIRLGVIRPKYDEVIIHGGGRPVALVKIVRVETKRVRELTDADAVKDGFKNKRELLKALKKAYKVRLSGNDLVTIIEFKVLKPITGTVDEWMGLRPVDIARIALRYDNELSEEERKVLIELTRAGSLRKAAIKLYGSIAARWRIKRILKKSLERLKEKGILG